MAVLQLRRLGPRFTSTGTQIGTQGGSTLLVWASGRQAQQDGMPYATSETLICRERESNPHEVALGGF